MEATLVIVQGKANRSRVVVQLPSVIGRGSDADLRVAHPMVSRHHCRLYEENGLVKVRDLDSLNGIFVGDQKVREATLPPNAVFSLGPLSFRAEYEYFEDPCHTAPDPSEAIGAAAAVSQKVYSSEPEHGTEQSDLTPPMARTTAAPADAGLPETTTIEQKRPGQPVPSGQTKPPAADGPAECGPPTARDRSGQDGLEQTTDEAPQGPDLHAAPTASASREETAPVDHPAGSGPLPGTAPPDDSRTTPDDPAPTAKSPDEDEQLSKFLQGLD